MKPRVKKDPFEETIEFALRPGVFIRYGACFQFVGDLEGVAAGIAKLTETDPSRAVVLYEQAGLTAEWEKIVSLVRAEHHRKKKLMRGFEELVAGRGPGDKPSFLERAKARWKKRLEEGER